VLNNGEIAESGTHVQLTPDKGRYYQLLKNELEI
jgi:ATP-binding cassette subfamily B protein